MRAVNDALGASAMFRNGATLIKAQQAQANGTVLLQPQNF